ncbi:MAG: glycoside hydrolase family 57 protein [bacterium]
MSGLPGLWAVLSDNRRPGGSGYLALVLHAHLPFVRHPDYEEFLEERWLFEAITETYIPLLKVFEGLVEDRIPFRLTFILSPTLLSMLTDPLLQERYLRHLDKLIGLAEREVQRTRSQPEFNRLARDYHKHFSQCRQRFLHNYQRDLATAFSRYAKEGFLEIITTAATHAYLPVFSHQPQAVKAQIKVGIDCHKRFFGESPAGFWLPECGYFPDLDKILKGEGIDFFFSDAHAILYGNPVPRYGTYAPVYTPSGTAVFARDLESSAQVWSSRTGYPGDFSYRDFYRDIGYDLNFPGRDERSPLGIKYYRITGGEEEKSVYLPEAASRKIAEHARHFLDCRREQIKEAGEFMERSPLIVSPYDAELFGHWWHEGPQWLDRLFRELHYRYSEIKPVTPSEYLVSHPDNQTVRPIMSSWGVNGYSEVWLNRSNEWIYPPLHQGIDQMSELVSNYSSDREIIRRALKQAARELLLAMSSDWPFIMKSGTVVQYATKRVKDHLANFQRLYREIKTGVIDQSLLKNLESRHNLFPDLDIQTLLPQYSSTPVIHKLG